jgi:hypothetical protein
VLGQLHRQIQIIEQEVQSVIVLSPAFVGAQ